MNKSWLTYVLYVHPPDFEIMLAKHDIFMLLNVILVLFFSYSPKTFYLGGNELIMNTLS